MLLPFGMIRGILQSILCVLLLAPYTAWCQTQGDDPDVPFQVIFAQKVSNNKGQVVSNLDLISIDEVLTIHKGGALGLMHYFGFPIELTGDTVIQMRELHNQFDLLRTGKKKSKYKNIHRPNIEYLFISNDKEADKARLSSMGACFDCGWELKIIYPPRHQSMQVFITDDLCMEWEPTGSDRYEIKLENEFGDSVAVFTSSTHTLRISVGDMNRLTGADPSLIMQIRDMKTGKSRTDAIIQKFPSKLIDSPFECPPQKATYALIAAFYMEFSRPIHNDEAEEYYKLATILSDNAFFKTMLDNYYKRQR